MAGPIESNSVRSFLGGARAPRKLRPPQPSLLDVVRDLERLSPHRMHVFDSSPAIIKWDLKRCSLEEEYHSDSLIRGQYLLLCERFWNLSQCDTRLGSRPLPRSCVRYVNLDSHLNIRPTKSQTQMNPTTTKPIIATTIGRSDVSASDAAKSSSALDLNRVQTVVLTSTIQDTITLELPISQRNVIP